MFVVGGLVFLEGELLLGGNGWKEGRFGLSERTCVVGESSTVHSCVYAFARSVCVLTAEILVGVVVYYRFV